LTAVKKEEIRGDISSLILFIEKYIKAQHHPPTPSSSEEGEKLKTAGGSPATTEL